MKGKKYLCTFGDKRLQKSAERFLKQAKEMTIYNEIFIYNEDDLDETFRNHFKNKFQLKGFGFWVWKPQIILQTLEKMNEGDILQYTDLGCHLNKNGIKRLEEYFQIANESETGLLGFDMTQKMEYQYTKGDLFDYFNARNNEELYQGQIAATVIFIKKCVKSIEIIKSYLKVFYDDFSLVDDTPSVGANFSEFIEHRYDQSVWSLLAKINKVPLISHSEQYSSNWAELSDYPILAKRDKVFKRTLFQKVIGKLQTFRNKIKKH